MLITPLTADGGLAVFDYRCDAGLGDRPFTEVHQTFSLSYVRKGSFGCQVRGQAFELVTGSLMLGHPGDEFLCTHDHHRGGDECLSFHFSAECVEALGGDAELWKLGCIAPMSQLMVLGELGQAAAEQRCDVGLDEVGMWLAARFVEVVSGQSYKRPQATERDRQRAVEAALFIEAHSREAIGLEHSAERAGLTPFHFLRLFTRVVGVSPHQYRIRCRVRHAARLLADDQRPITDVAFEAGFADLSNFVRTFHRAAGVSPRRFRQLAKGDRKILQDRLTHRA